jgi:hypothetical protein
MASSFSTMGLASPLGSPLPVAVLDRALLIQEIQAKIRELQRF